MPKTYILQKDIPELTAGTMFTSNDGGDSYFGQGSNGRIFFTKQTVESCPDFFKEEQDISMLMVLNGDMITIKDKEVEYVLPVKRLLELVKQDDVSGWNDRRYTKENMRKCFRVGNQLPRNLDLALSFDFYFEDCIKMINEKR